jgi:SAM-dependent methyltransferase
MGRTYYDEDYFERGVAKGVSGYTDYRWMPERTIPMVSHMCEALGIRYGDTVLDFGCAKGFVTLAFNLLWRDAYGVDISEYAISHSHPDVSDRLRLMNTGEDIPVLCDGEGYDWCIAKDVLEHIAYDDLPSLLKRIGNVCNNLFVVVPLGENGKYVVPSYEHDVTHIIREGLPWWENSLETAGLKVVDASYDARFVKGNYASFERGNGFLRVATG